MLQLEGFDSPRPTGHLSHHNETKRKHRAMTFNLLDAYGINEEDIPENVSAGRRQVPDGVYGYTVTDVNEYVNEEQGSKSLYIDYDLGDDGAHREWFTVEHATEEDYVTRGFSDLRKRLVFFGQSLSDFRPDEIIGRSGTLEIKTGRNGKRQYLAEFSVDGDDGPEEAEAPAEDAPMAMAEKPAAKKAAAKPAAKTATAARGTTGNPFGPKK